MTVPGLYLWVFLLPGVTIFQTTCFQASVLNYVIAIDLALVLVVVWADSAEDPEVLGCAPGFKVMRLRAPYFMYFAFTSWNFFYHPHLPYHHVLQIMPFTDTIMWAILTTT